MDLQLYKAAREGNVTFLMGISSKSLLFLSHMKNNALHVAAKMGHMLFCLKVVELSPQPKFLLCQKNAKGDTPIHIAARAGHLELVTALADCYQPPSSRIPLQLDPISCVSGKITRIALSSESEGDLEGGEGLEPPWRMRNLENNTALHLALKSKYQEVTLYLLRLEPGLACVVNSAGESALFLAAEGKCSRVVEEILTQDQSSFSLDGPNGQNPLHAAVTARSLRITRCLLKKIPELVKETDKDGKTALHYTAAARHSLKITRLLLKKDPSAAYILDNDGLSPLLIAANSGTIAACRTILNFCPDSVELLDRNGRNALHLAVKNNTLFVVRRLLKIPEIRELINEVDNEGNTPLHLATENHQCLLVKRLMVTPLIDLNVKNKEGLTALDICESEWELSFRQVFFIIFTRWMVELLKSRKIMPNFELLLV